MKIKEIITESPTDLVAHYHVQASSKIDQYMNSVARQYAEQTKEYYKKNFKKFLDNGNIPVFTESPKDERQWSVQPDEEAYQSPGYRGKQYAAARANQPYDKKVQKHEIVSIGLDQAKGAL